MPRDPTYDVSRAMFQGNCLSSVRFHSYILGCFRLYGTPPVLTFVPTVTAPLTSIGMVKAVVPSLKLVPYGYMPIIELSDNPRVSTSYISAAPPRKLVLPLPNTSQANPIRGLKLCKE